LSYLERSFTTKEMVLIFYVNFPFIYEFQHYLQMEYDECEDTKEVIWIRISKKDRQHNGQKKKYKRTNNDLQNIHIKLKIEYHEPH
jgi:hypothetical protein